MSRTFYFTLTDEDRTRKKNNRKDDSHVLQGKTRAKRGTLPKL
jgi:hypothetical protein